MDTAAPNATAASMPRPSKLNAIVIALLVNAVPLVGVLYFGWSAINVLVLYWFENLLIVACTCVRLLVHRRLTRKRGYWRHSNRLGIEINGKPVQMGFIGEYASGALAFTLAHGVFVAGIAALVHQNYPDQAMWQVSLDQVFRGALAIAAMLGVELIVDVTRIRGASFAAMRDYAQGRMSRIVVLHLAIIGGMLAMAMSDSPMGVLYVLIALKTGSDLLGIALRDRPRTEGEAPPAWTLRMADKVARDKGGAAGFLRKLDADRDQAKRDASDDEQPMAGSPR